MIYEKISYNYYKVWYMKKYQIIMIKYDTWKISYNISKVCFMIKYMYGGCKAKCKPWQNKKIIWQRIILDKIWYKYEKVWYMQKYGVAATSQSYNS